MEMRSTRIASAATLMEIGISALFVSDPCIIRPLRTCRHRQHARLRDTPPSSRLWRSLAALRCLPCRQANRPAASLR
ncbi:hypothetical protein Hsero_0359 [Herbaspirillum seropedicae SmR1]|uniref:Uncharacterized protein n=1 Tax=Herbaspirillum seropedicae (strain SmR1) TaxID=757424 RepID=D8IW87_HERSS|nr:hypothetical protein Hsero_0359 [Herbaspirillum seropedicae SmR1]AON52663.1 hypothetical protein Hsc_0350 [Herbaspirillum seropedicae]